MHCEQRTSSFGGHDLGRKTCQDHTLARDWLNKARRQAAQDIQEGSMDDFMNKMGLGDPDPSNTNGV